MDNNVYAYSEWLCIYYIISYDFIRPNGLNRCCEKRKTGQSKNTSRSLELSDLRDNNNMLKGISYVQHKGQ